MSRIIFNPKTSEGLTYAKFMDLAPTMQKNIATFALNVRGLLDSLLESITYNRILQVSIASVHIWLLTEQIRELSIEATNATTKDEVVEVVEISLEKLILPKFIEKLR